MFCNNILRQQAHDSRKVIQNKSTSDAFRVEPSKRRAIERKRNISLLNHQMTFNSNIFIKIRNNMNKFDYADVMPILETRIQCATNDEPEQVNRRRASSTWQNAKHVFSSQNNNNNNKAHRPKPNRTDRKCEKVPETHTHSVTKFSYKRAIRMEKKKKLKICEK